MKNLDYLWEDYSSLNFGNFDIFLFIELLIILVIYWMYLIYVVYKCFVFFLKLMYRISWNFEYYYGYWEF